MADPLENITLLDETIQPTKESNKSYKLVTALCLIGTVALSFVAFTQKSNHGVTSTNLKGSGVDYKSFESEDDSDGWYIYKIAYPGHDDDVESILQFMTDHSGGTDCSAVNLGCEGFKITCNYDMKQIHYVVAPALVSTISEVDGMGTNGWIEKAMEGYGDMSSFDAFMHDKIQLFVEDPIAKGKELEGAGHSIMRRSSLVTEENVDGVEVKHTVGHSMVAISGKIWDFVGIIDNPSDAATEGFEPWSDEECSIAHEIRSSDFVKMREYTQSNKESLLIAIHVATSSLSNKGIEQITGILKGMTSAKETIITSKHCDVSVLHYYNEWEELTGGVGGDQIYLKHVVNHHYQTSETTQLSIGDYEDYIYKVHEKYLSSEDGDITHRWRGWDHFLDQHVGVMYAGPSLISQYESAESNVDYTLAPSPAPPPALPDDSVEEYTTESNEDTQDTQESHVPIKEEEEKELLSIPDDQVGIDDIAVWAEELHTKCLEMGKEVNEVLLNEQLLVGKRFILSDGDHYYTGFQGSSMAVEFNTECHYGEDGATDVCTCVSMNSDVWAMNNLDSYDVRYSECAIIYETEDGHSSTDVSKDSDNDSSGGDKPEDIAITTPKAIKGPHFVEDWDTHTHNT